jgi:hypothetical protein
MWLGDSNSHTHTHTYTHTLSLSLSLSFSLCIHPSISPSFSLTRTLTHSHAQVEVQVSNDFDPNFTSAVLIPRRIIEDLNGGLRKLAQAKVSHLQQRMQLRKGIHVLEWEHRRLDLCAVDCLV